MFTPRGIIEHICHVSILSLARSKCTHEILICCLLIKAFETLVAVVSSFVLLNLLYFMLMLVRFGSISDRRTSVRVIVLHGLELLYIASHTDLLNRCLYKLSQVDFGGLIAVVEGLGCSFQLKVHIIEELAHQKSVLSELLG